MRKKSALGKITMRATVFSAAFAVLVAAASAGNFNVWLQHDCHGNFQLMPSMEMALGKISTYGTLNKALGLFQDKIKSAATCRCPSLSQAQVDKFFDYSMEGVMSGLDGQLNRTELDVTCNAYNTSFETVLADIGVPGGDSITGSNWDPEGDVTHISNPPSTCDPATYSTQGCTFKVAGPGFRDGDQIEFAMKECGAGKFPFFQMSCTGPTCANALKPCQFDSDCGEPSHRLKCENPLALIEDEDTTDDLAELIGDILEELDLYSASQCGTQVPADMVKTLYGYLGGPKGFDVTGASSLTKLCIGKDEWDNFEDDITADGSLTLQSWDGVMGNGTAAFSHYSFAFDIEDPKPTTECGKSYDDGTVLPLIQHQCSGEFFVSPLSPFKAMMEENLFDMVAEVAVPWMNAMANGCDFSYRGANWEDYYIWQPGFWMRMFSTTPSYTIDQTTATLFRVLQKAIYDNDDFNEQIIFPEGCDYEAWANTGTCRFKVDALGYYLMMNISLRVQISNCAHDGLPYFYVECVGTDCRNVFEFYNLKSCSSDTDCPLAPRLRCKATKDYDLFEDGKGIFGPLLWDSQANDTCSNPETAWNTLFDIFQVLNNNAPTGSYPSGLCETVLSVSETNDTAFEEDSLVRTTGNKNELLFMKPLLPADETSCTKSGFDGAASPGGSSAPRLPGSSGSSGSNSGSSNTTAIVVGILVPLALIALAAVGYVVYKKQKERTANTKSPYMENPAATVGIEETINPMHAGNASVNADDAN